MFIESVVVSGPELRMLLCISRRALTSFKVDPTRVNPILFHVSSLPWVRRNLQSQLLFQGATLPLGLKFENDDGSFFLILERPFVLNAKATLIDEKGSFGPWRKT